MTVDQLNSIETALGVQLPLAYRSVSTAFPFRPIGRDRVYWFYDDPAAVIHATCYPHEDGGYATCYPHEDGGTPAPPCCPGMPPSVKVAPGIYTSSTWPKTACRSLL